MTTQTVTINYETLEARALVRSVFALAYNGNLDFDKAAQVLSAVGIPTTPDQVGDAVELSDAVACPAAAIECGFPVHGRAGTRRQAEDNVRETAQYDLDALVTHLANGARPVSLTSAVLSR